MALVTTKEMFEKAFQGGYAIGAFNINNMEIVQGVVAAAKAQNSAVILQVSKSAEFCAFAAATTPCTISILLMLNAPIA